MKQLGVDPAEGFEFLAYGDRRALIADDWPSLIDMMDGLAARHDRLLFLVDTGDIVEDGSHSDQFQVLADLMRKLVRLPYLVAAGNHEVDANSRGPARANTAALPRAGPTSPRGPRRPASPRAAR